MDHNTIGGTFWSDDYIDSGAGYKAIIWSKFSELYTLKRRILLLSITPQCSWNKEVATSSGGGWEELWELGGSQAQPGGC